MRSCKHKGFILYLTFGVMFFSSLACLLGIGLGVVAPYFETNHFKSTECNTTGIVNVGEIKVLSCSSKMPCVQIRVNYRTEDGEIRRSTLFDEYNNYSSLDQPKCSIRKCRDDTDETKALVREFVKNYGDLHRVYPCYYDPKDPKEVLLHVMPLWAVLLGLFLTGGFIIVSGMGTLLYKPSGACKS